MGTVLSLLVLIAIALLVGAFVLWKRGGSRKQALLMVILAVVAMANVVIWTLPDASGQSPLAQIPGKSPQ